MEVEVNHVFKTLLSMVPKLEEFIKELQDFSAKWALKSDDINEILSHLIDAEKELSLLKQKSTRSSKQCVFYGRTSTGKSALINRLIGTPILPTGFGSTSKRMVEIKASPNQETFIYIVNEEDIFVKDDVKNMKQICKSTSCKDNSIPIKLFYPTESSPIFKNSFVIFDTPGLGKGTFEKEIVKLCNEADLLVMVVSSLSELGSLEKNILLNSKNHFSNFDIIVVYTFCDLIHNGSDFEEVYQAQEQQAKNYLFNELSLTDTNKQVPIIFFLSTLENQNPDTNLSENQKSKRDMFNEFKERILNETTELGYFRKMSTLKMAENIFEVLFTNTDLSFTAITNEMTELVDRIKLEMDAMENLGTLNTKINKEIDNAFKAIVECVIRNGKKVVECKNETKSQGLEKVINETVTNEINKLKEKINELITGIECSEFCKNILMEIYFNKYFNYKPNLNHDSDNEIMKNLQKINKTDHVKSGLKAGVDGALGAAAVASGGITVGATAAVEAATGIISLITGKNISILSGLKFIKKPFNFIWDREEENIKKHFMEIKDTLKDSLIKFPEKIEMDINQILDPLKEDFLNIQNTNDKLKDEIKQFQKTSFIYL